MRSGSVRLHWLLGAYLLAYAAVVVGCSGGSSDQPHSRVNILLVTLDTTRADRLGSYGNERIDTPNLDRLAREGTQFDNAFTPIPSTLPSHCSMMTGNYPAYHGVHDNGVYLLDQSANTLAEILQAKGYSTAGFVSAFVLDRQFQLDQGFDLYDDEMTMPLINADPEKLPDSLPEERKRWMAQMATQYQRRANAVTPKAIKWLKQQQSQPFFLWVHYFDPHQPYQAPGTWETKYDPDYAGPMDGDIDTFYREMERHGKRFLQSDWEHMVARYDAEIAFMDEWIGRLLQALEDTGRADETLVIVVGDHGESFGEHKIQIWEHNQTIYDEVMRVPLIVRCPDGIGAGKNVTRLVRTIDLAPTVLDWLDLPDWKQMQGDSLMSVLERPDGFVPGEVLMEARCGKQVQPAKRSFVGLRTEQFKLILALDPEQDLMTVDNPDAARASQLFDVAADSKEQQSVVDSRPKQFQDLKRNLTEKIVESYRNVDAERELGAVESDALRSLGYVK